MLRETTELAEQGRGERIPRLAAEVDEADAWHGCPDPGGEREALEPMPALGSGRRAPVEGNGTLQRGAFRGDRSCVVPGIGLLLVGLVVLLVDDDQADTVERSEDRGPSADDDPRVTARDPRPLVTPLGVTERRMDDRDRVTEALPEATDGLRGERDLGDEHDHTVPTLESGRGGLEVDLGLPAPRWPDQQQMGAAGRSSASTTRSIAASWAAVS